MEMKQNNKIRINKKNISNMDKSITQYWDDQIPGFGIRNNKTSSVYMYMYRNQYGQPRMMTIGKTNIISAEQARDIVLEYAIDVKKGGDPAKNKRKLKQIPTIAEICDIYLEQGCIGKKQSTIKGDIGRIETIIKPLVGNIKIAAFTHADAEKMLKDIISGNKIIRNIKLDKPRARSNVKGGAGAASRTMQLFSAIMTFAVKNEIIDKNPVSGLKKPKSKVREEYLTPQEITKLGKVMTLEKNRALYWQDINTIKLLILTGCRKGEILSLKWSEVNFEEHCFDFEDTKTGKQKRPFGQAAEDLLLMLKQNNKNNSEYVFPGTKAGTHRDDVLDRLKYFLQYKDEAGNLYVTHKAICVHSLRHTFATTANMLGYSDLIIAGLLGHKLGSVTSRYAHTVDKTVLEAATTVSKYINDLLLGIA